MLKYYITYMYTIGFAVPIDVVIVTNHFYINYYYTRAVFGATPTDVATLCIERKNGGHVISSVLYSIWSGNKIL